MPRLIPALVAEAIGVFALSLIGILAIYQFKEPGSGGLIGVALAHGLILSVMVSALGATSGAHFNPAVTIGLLVVGKIKPGPAVAYIVAQLFGGFLAGLVMMAIFARADAPGIIMSGTPALAKLASGAPIITATAGFFAELVATFFLMMAVWGTAVDPRAPKIGGFGIGLTVSADILALGPLTGAAMNPARAFGPALAATLGGATYDWANHWIFWAGPIAGAVVASVLYRWVILPRDLKN